ncbi:MAG: hypothetical protein RIT27_2369 [Pseudomonadota bacterium]
MFQKVAVLFKYGSDMSTNLPQLPSTAFLAINRCNLPARILGSATYQQFPMPLKLDGVHELHARLFRGLNHFSKKKHRANYFKDYMTVHFCLESLEEIGLNLQKKQRSKANYLQIIRGWSFNANAKEGAGLKGWVESRFGLLPRYHGGKIRHSNDFSYHNYLIQRAAALYETNALEQQLDVLYTYAQYELAHNKNEYVTLYRGINNLDNQEILAKTKNGTYWILLNSLNSFSCSKERADEFGDLILTTNVPLSKIFCYSGLLPNLLQGEDEYLVIGGLYEISFLR